MKATNIKWDTDGEYVNLPTDIEIPDGMIDEDEISDYISDETGYCHMGFELDYNGMKICCPHCGKEIIIKFSTARCEECSWMCADVELDDVMLN